MPTEPEKPKLKQKDRAFKPFLTPLARADKAAGQRFLAALLSRRGQTKRQRQIARAWLRLRLLYERFSLGADAQSLYLRGQAAKRGLSAPPLTVGQYLCLLALSAEES